MSGLLDSLSSASNSLLAQRMGLDVAGQNIANVNTPGYSRRTIDLQAVGGSDPQSAGRGVVVLGVRALRDDLVNARLWQEGGNTAHDGAIADTLGSVEAAVGMPGSGLDQQLTAFFDSFSALANDPTSLSARDGVVRAGAQLATSFHTL